LWKTCESERSSPLKRSGLKCGSVVEFSISDHAAIGPLLVKREEFLGELPPLSVPDLLFFQRRPGLNPVRRVLSCPSYASKYLQSGNGSRKKRGCLKSLKIAVIFCGFSYGTHGKHGTRFGVQLSSYSFLFFLVCGRPFFITTEHDEQE